MAITVNRNALYDWRSNQPGEIMEYLKTHGRPFTLNYSETTNGGETSTLVMAFGANAKFYVQYLWCTSSVATDSLSFTDVSTATAADNTNTRILAVIPSAYAQVFMQFTIPVVFGKGIGMTNSGNAMKNFVMQGYIL